MNEGPQPGQVWCWGSGEHSAQGERLWLLVEMLYNQCPDPDVSDCIAIDLEDGLSKQIFNLPIRCDSDAVFCDITRVAWRRVA